MRGDNGAAVWWLAPHRPAGPGGEEKGSEERQEEHRREKEERKMVKRRGRREEEQIGEWKRKGEEEDQREEGRGREGPRVRKGTSDPQSRGERRLCVGCFCVGEQPC